MSSLFIVGTAVWCLCSDETDSVQYHIDYAELYRYETNVIYPPLYAGTCQVAPLSGDEDMVGGDFQANVQGIEHYRHFGYKGMNMHQLYMNICNDCIWNHGIQANWFLKKNKRRIWVVGIGLQRAINEIVVFFMVISPTYPHR